MQKALSMVLTLLLCLTPACLAAAEGDETAALVTYISDDGSFAFRYPDTWDAPAPSEEDANTLWLIYDGGAAQMMVRKLPGQAASTEAVIAAMDEQVAGMLAENDTTVLDADLSGMVISLPNGDAVQQVFTMTVDGQDVLTHAYYISLGDSMYLCQMSALVADHAWDQYLTDMEYVLSSLDAV